MSGEFLNATCVSVHDGDTATLQIEYPFAPHKWVVEQTACRLIGIQAAEINAKDAAEKQRATEAWIFLTSKIQDKRVQVQLKGSDKYGGREDAIIFVNGTNINELMISSGHAVKWDGNGPKPIG